MRIELSVMHAIMKKPIYVLQNYRFSESLDAVKI